MKNFIKNNWFKISLLVILVIAFCIYKPSGKVQNTLNVNNRLEDLNKTKSLISTEDVCKKDSSTYFDNFIKDSINVSGSSYEKFLFQTHYNQKMNKCFMYFSYDFFPPTKPEKAILLKYSYFYEVKKEIKNINNSEIQTWNSSILSNSINSSYGIDNKDVNSREYNNFINERMEIIK